MKKFGFLLVILAMLATLLLAACGGSGTDDEVTPTTTATTATQTAGTQNADVTVASQMAGFFYNIQAVHKYYDDGLTATAEVDMSVPKTALNLELGQSIIPVSNIKLLPQEPIKNVPPEFLKPLPPSGAIAAPPGACPAAANPSVTFKTAGGKTVTPQLIEDKNLKTIPGDMVTMNQNASGSLFSAVSSAVTGFDMRLASSQGWDTLLWDKLESLQAPAESLMDYQLWNASPDLEKQITDMYLQKLQASGVPDMVIDAFNNSHKSGWFANSQPTPQDALAKMDIVAELTGSLNGTVHEQRDFSIPGAGQVPIFGTQTGDGTVTWQHPELGLMTFKVNIMLDKFDEQGRAIGGTATGVDAEKGYEIRFTFNPDGTKKGEVLKNGVVVGLLNMTVNADKFENYLDVKTNKTQPLPTPK